VRRTPPTFEFLYEEIGNLSSLRDSLCHNPMMTQVDSMSARLFDNLRARALKTAVEQNQYQEILDSMLDESEIMLHRSMNRLSACLDQRIQLWLKLVKNVPKASITHE